MHAGRHDYRPGSSPLLGSTIDTRRYHARGSCYFVCVWGSWRTRTRLSIIYSRHSALPIHGRAMIDHPAHVTPQRLDAIVRHPRRQGVHILEYLQRITPLQRHKALDASQRQRVQQSLAQRLRIDTDRLCRRTTSPRRADLLPAPS